MAKSGITVQVKALEKRRVDLIWRIGGLERSLDRLCRDVFLLDSQLRGISTRGARQKLELSKAKARLEWLESKVWYIWKLDEVALITRFLKRKQAFGEAKKALTILKKGRVTPFIDLKKVSDEGEGLVFWFKVNGLASEPFTGYFKILDAPHKELDLKLREMFGKDLSKPSQRQLKEFDEEIAEYKSYFDVLAEDD